MLKADMHIHSTLSDGILTPEEILNWANKKKLGAIAISDHDTLYGFNEALNYMKENDSKVCLIPGVELSCIFNGDEVHLLGYCFDYKSTSLNSTLNMIRDKRENRAQEIIKRLNNIGIDISFDEIMQKSEDETAIGRPHIARELTVKGYTKNNDEAFQKYLKEGAIAYVPRYKLSLEDGIKLIHNNGGIAILAHPGLIKGGYTDIVENFDIDGVEIYHPKNNKFVKNELLHIARRKKMIVTGGSDFHDVYENGEPTIGICTVDIGHRCSVDDNNICIRIDK